MGAKKTKIVITVGGHRIITSTYGTVHASRRTIQNLPLRMRCAQGGPHSSIIYYCLGHRSSSRGQALQLYLTCKLPGHLCMDGMDGENIPNEEIAAAVAVGASVIEHWSTVSGIAVVWSGR